MIIPRSGPECADLLVGWWVGGNSTIALICKSVQNIWWSLRKELVWICLAIHIWRVYSVTCQLLVQKAVQMISCQTWRGYEVVSYRWECGTSSTQTLSIKIIEWPRQIHGHGAAKEIPSPPVNGPKDPWPCVLSLPGAQGGFVGDPTSLARDSIYRVPFHV